MRCPRCLRYMLCMLFLLLTAQRCQTLHLVCINDIRIKPDSVVVSTPHLLKQTKPGHHLSDIILRSYPTNSNLCIKHILSEYLTRTACLRGDVQQLLISSQKPHKAVSRATIARWVKLILSKAGINPMFGAHSTRAASSSAAKNYGVPINVIARTAGWSNAQTFGKYYNKRVNAVENVHSVQSALLS